MRPRSLAAFLLLTAGLALLGAESELVIEIVGRESFAVPADFRLLRTITRSPAGDLYFLAAKPWRVFKLAKSAARVEELPLKDLADIQRGGAEFTEDLQVDGRGYLYIPASSRRQAQPLAAVLVFDPQGVYRRTIRLTPRVQPRHLALDAAGNLFVLGVEAYGPRRPEPCFMIHKYSDQGQRLASFSECPAQSELESPGDIRRLPGRDRLADEIDQGQLWVRKAGVYQLLPGLQALRVFDGSGKTLREIDLEPPQAARLLRRRGMIDTPYAIIQARSAFDLPEGRWLLNWRHSGVVYLSLHGPDGQPLSQPTPPEPSIDAPLFSDDEGYCYFLRRPAEGRRELLRTRIRLSP